MPPLKHALKKGSIHGRLTTPKDTQGSALSPPPYHVSAVDQTSVGGSSPIQRMLRIPAGQKYSGRPVSEEPLTTADTGLVDMEIETPAQTSTHSSAVPHEPVAPWDLDLEIERRTQSSSVTSAVPPEPVAPWNLDDDI